MIKLVMVFGTFEILHPGHLNLLQTAKTYGKKLIVVVARDKTVSQVKGHLPINSQRDRLNLISALKIVDLAVLGDKVDPLKVVKKYQPGVICLGYDQKAFVEQLKNAFPEQKIIRLKAYRSKYYKSSKLK